MKFNLRAALANTRFASDDLQSAELPTSSTLVQLNNPLSRFLNDQLALFQRLNFISEQHHNGFLQQNAILIIKQHALMLDVEFADQFCLKKCIVTSKIDVLLVVCFLLQNKQYQRAVVISNSQGVCKLSDRITAVQTDLLKTTYLSNLVL